MEWKNTIQANIARLEQGLTSGSAVVKIGPRGELAFSGWQNEDKISDLCAFRILSARNSFALRQAVMRAETLAGRKVNRQAIAAGVHSHDEGQTWSTH